MLRYVKVPLIPESGTSPDAHRVDIRPASADLNSRTLRLGACYARGIRFMGGGASENGAAERLSDAQRVLRYKR